MDLKRPSDGTAPAAKRVNFDEPVTAEDVETFQKDALARQMGVYRRERDALQAQVDAALKGDIALKDELKRLTQQYADAERRVERQKSDSVAKLTQNGQPPAKEGVDEKSEPVVVAAGEDPQVTAQLKEQLAAAEGEVSNLQKTIETLDARLTSAEAEKAELDEKLKVFPTVVKQAEEKLRIAQRDTARLGDDAAKLQKVLSEVKSGQAAFEQTCREKVGSLVAELERRVNTAEADVARIRSNRDELLSEVNVLKSDNAVTKNELKRQKEIAEIAEDEKQAFLEARSQPADVDASEIPEDKLREHCLELKKQNKMLLGEFSSLEQGFARASAKAKAAVKATAAAEQKLGVLNAAKIRSDEKYIGAMRARDAEAAELVRARQALTRSADVVAELRAVEQRLTANATRYLKQIAELESGLRAAKRDTEAAQRQQSETESQMAVLRERLTSVHDRTSELESSKHAAEVARRQAETKIEKLNRQLDTLRTVSGLGSSSDVQEQLESLRSMAMCPVCQKNWKDRAITTCGHTLCEDCVQSRLAARMRKCPMCNGHFGSNDVLVIHL